jgi:hypothetical protein
VQNLDRNPTIDQLGQRYETMARQPRIDLPGAWHHVMPTALEMSTNQVANVLRRFDAELCDK